MPGFEPPSLESTCKANALPAPRTLSFFFFFIERESGEWKRETEEIEGDRERKKNGMKRGRGR